MSETPDDPRDLGYYYALSQVGIVMVVPIALGYWLDHLLGWFPGLTVTGVVLGLATGFLQLMKLLNRPPKDPLP